MLGYRVHCTTKVFAARTVTSDLVALVALIASYPILFLTNNNRMMISVRRMFKKKRKKRICVASSTNILLFLLEYSLLITSYNSG